MARCHVRRYKALDYIALCWEEQLYILAHVGDWLGLYGIAEHIAQADQPPLTRLTNQHHLHPGSACLVPVEFFLYFQNLIKRTDVET